MLVLLMTQILDGQNILYNACLTQGQDSFIHRRRHHPGQRRLRDHKLNPIGELSFVQCMSSVPLHSQPFNKKEQIHHSRHQMGSLVFFSGCIHRNPWAVNGDNCTTHNSTSRHLSTYGTYSMCSIGRTHMGAVPTGNPSTPTLSSQMRGPGFLQDTGHMVVHCDCMKTRYTG